MAKSEYDIVERLAHRAFVLATRMIDEANHRDDQELGDPTVGGHPAASSSCVHILSTLRFLVASPHDTYAVKPHGSPSDHAINFLLDIYRDPITKRWLSLEESQKAMSALRQFSFHGEAVFQSYHAESDPDSFGYFPSGSVGIPPVMSLYHALALRYAKDHGFKVPDDVHHWSLIGDSEAREGSLLEAMPEAAERGLSQVTWIIDYNRQNLDGERLHSPGIEGSDADRLERTFSANGWEALQIRHGRKREAAFKKKGGELFRKVLESGLKDPELQALLLRKDGAFSRERLLQKESKLKGFLADFDDAALQGIIEDLGGHDIEVLAKALSAARKSDKPTLLVIHTLKGHGLSVAATPGNHSDLPPRSEVEELVKAEGLDPADPYQRFPKDSEEGRFLLKRRDEFRKVIEDTEALKQTNLKAVREAIEEVGELPDEVGIDLSLTPLAFTQYVWGQAAAKLLRIGNYQALKDAGLRVQEPKADEKRWSPVAPYLLTMAPDVGTSTNINPAMDEKIYGVELDEDYYETMGLKQRRRPKLTPHEGAYTRHIRFEITEASTMSAAGAFGKMADHYGVPLFPFMTIYDFFIKRAYDQLYLNLYWGSRFLVVGTPSGVTLAPEGAQHSWKSDIQMPNLISWEPMYGVEVDWIIAETLKRAFTQDDEQRTGVVLRCVTRALPQKEMLDRLRRHRRFKRDSSQTLRPEGVSVPRGVLESEIEPLSDTEILSQVRSDVLNGAYYLVDYRGYEGYEPGDNVVHLFSMGAVGSEVLAASDLLLQQGIYANVLVVTSPDLLVGNLAQRDGYLHLKETLGINSTLYVSRKAQNGHGIHELEERSDLIEVAAGRVPLVSVVDGEIGLLDNIGSIAGVRHETLGVRKPSKSGRPSDVYRLHHLDANSIANTALEVLAESALDEVVISRSLLENLEERPTLPSESEAWEQAWGIQTEH